MTPDPKDFADAIDALKAIAAWRVGFRQLRDEHVGYRCAAFDALESAVERAESTLKQIEHG